MTLEERLAQNPPATSKAKTNVGDKTPVSIDASFNKIEKKVNGKEVDATRGKLGNGGAGHTPSKPYSDTFK
jgi:hypothetical protein